MREVSFHLLARLSDAVPDLMGRHHSWHLCAFFVLYPYPSQPSEATRIVTWMSICPEPASSVRGVWGMVKELRLCIEYASWCCPCRAWQVIYLSLTILFCSTGNGKNNNTWPARIRREHIRKTTLNCKYGIFMVFHEEASLQLYDEKKTNKTQPKCNQSSLENQSPEDFQHLVAVREWYIISVKK